MDISVDYAEHIPTLVIAHMIGFPPEDEALFREFVHIVLEAVDAPVEERIEMFEPVRIYFERQLMDHLENPRDDLTDFLLNAEIGGQKLAPEHVFGSMVLLIVAGIDTTWSAIGSSLWYLAQHPDEAERLRHDPELMTLAIEARLAQTQSGVDVLLVRPLPREGDNECCGRAHGCCGRAHGHWACQ